VSSERTTQIQRHIADFGRKLGFDSDIEVSLETTSYSPRIDVVWYIDLTKYFRLHYLEKLFENNKGIYNSFKRFPFAGFEFESSTPNSKYQLGNISNLVAGNFMYKFLIVDENNASEKDVYRRLLKLKKYYEEHMGKRGIIVFDYSHFLDSISDIKLSDTFKIDYDDYNYEVYKKLNEKKSFEGIKQIVNILNKTGLNMYPNKYTPDVLKDRLLIESRMSKLSDNELVNFYNMNRGYWHPSSNIKNLTSSSKRYLPKLDIAAGFYIPKNFITWLYKLSESVKNDIVHYPLLYNLKNKQKIFVPLISIEVESKINKHSNGGIINMSCHSYCGILASKVEMLKQIKYYKEYFGIRNIIPYKL
jgi:hypothetical protein